MGAACCAAEGDHPTPELLGSVSAIATDNSEASGSVPAAVVSGTLSFEDGSSYTGALHNGKRHGRGRWQSRDSSYEGQWETDAQHGHGVQKWSDGRTYHGQFVRGRFSGSGRMFWHMRREQAVYEGQYVEDQKHGYGKLTWPDGCSYIGDWVEGKRHGHGFVSFPNSAPRVGNFENDRLKLWETPPEDDADHLCIVLQKSGDAKLGVDVDDRTLQITELNNGLVFEWNERAAASQRVSVGDYIVEVNGRCGDAPTLAQEISTSNVLRVRLRRHAAAVAFSRRGRSNSNSSLARADRLFDVELDKTQGTRIGIDVNMKDSKTMLIEGVNPGLMNSWNETAPPEQRVGPGDQVMEVNGRSGDIEHFLDEMKCDKVLRLRMKRGTLAALQVDSAGAHALDGGATVPQERVPMAPLGTGSGDGELTVQLTRTAGARLGIEVDVHDGRTLLVEKITGGLVAAWNEKVRADQRVSLGDRIYEINGVSGEASKLIAESKKDGPLKMRLQRYVPLDEQLLRADWSTATGQTYRMFHGTSLASAQSILRSGFRASAAGQLGPGVYLVEESNMAKAKRFAHDNFYRCRGNNREQEDGIPVIIVCEVTIRKHCTVGQKDTDGSWAARGYDAAFAPKTELSGSSEWCVADPKLVRALAVQELTGKPCPWGMHCPYLVKNPRAPGSPWGGTCPCANTPSSPKG